MSGFFDEWSCRMKYAFEEENSLTKEVCYFGAKLSNEISAIMSGSTA
jgi:hypothetical protein